MPISSLSSYLPRRSRDSHLPSPAVCHHGPCSCPPAPPSHISARPPPPCSLPGPARPAAPAPQDAARLARPPGTALLSALTAPPLGSSAPRAGRTHPRSPPSPASLSGPGSRQGLNRGLPEVTAVLVRVLSASPSWLVRPGLPMLWGPRRGLGPPHVCSCLCTIPQARPFPVTGRGGNPFSPCATAALTPSCPQPLGPLAAWPPRAQAGGSSGGTDPSPGPGHRDPCPP